MSTRARSMSATDAGMMPERGSEARHMARGYESLNVGLVVLAVDNPLKPGRWQGIGALLDHLFREGIPCVVLTQGRRADLVHWLDGMGCGQRLPMRICREDLGTNAILPTATLLACNRLAMPVRHTLVLADGPFGAAGGAAAGCTVIAIGSSAAQAALRRTGANHGVTDLAELVPVAMWNRMDGTRLHG